MCLYQIIFSSVSRDFSGFGDLLNLSLLCFISYSKASIRNVCLFVNALYNDTQDFTVKLSSLLIVLWCTICEKHN